LVETKSVGKTCYSGSFWNNIQNGLPDESSTNFFYS
jgi:hypothetical protein